MNAQSEHVKNNWKNQEIQAQIDPILLKKQLKDTVEANWQHVGTDGVSDGNQFQFRRMTLFVASTISKRIKFLSEIEFEPAEKEIAVEFAAVDVEFHPMLNLRGGNDHKPKSQ